MIYCIGEALVDMVTNDGVKYLCSPGGAPANCVVAATRMGAQAAFVGKVGSDRFGKLLSSTLLKLGVDCTYMYTSQVFPTSVAYAFIDSTGEREFSFYRDANAADLMLSADDVKDIDFTSDDTLCFGSCCLMSGTFCEALSLLVRRARRAGAVIATDVNLRPAMWNGNIDRAIRAYAEFLPYADIVKLSDEELEPVTHETNAVAAAEYLLMRSATAVFITHGAGGAEVFTKDNHFACSAKSVRVVDTVGAGDCFMGTILASCDAYGDARLCEQNFNMVLETAVYAATLSVTKSGGMKAYPSFDEVRAFSIENTRCNGDSLFE